MKKVMVQIGSLEDKYTNLEERVDKLEEKSQNGDNEDKIKEVCKREIIEQQEIEKRKLNMVVFNVYWVPPVSVALFVYGKRPIRKTNKRNLLYLISFHNPSPKTP